MKRGFTLIEAIMVVVLIGIIASLFAFYISEAVDSWGFLTGQKKLAATSRAALYKIVREIKRVDRVGSIVTFASREVSFIDVDGQSVTYSQEGTSLLRNSDILLGNLEDPGGLTFFYLDENGNETSTREAIRAVRVHLSLEGNENRFVIESAARIRSRRL
jgi:prepilin-type N-terminal cleavage/methylation domain-containing protein